MESGLWNIFEKSGSVDAYLAYRDYTAELNETDGFDDTCQHLRITASF